jgi:hypothetical protein
VREAIGWAIGDADGTNLCGARVWNIRSKNVNFYGSISLRIGVKFGILDAIAYG